MSALPPKADMCGATRDVRFGPIADVDRRKSVRVRALLSVRRIIVPKRRLEIRPGPMPTIETARKDGRPTGRASADRDGERPAFFR
jgi:hypothetical protein